MQRWRQCRQHHGTDLHNHGCNIAYDIGNFYNDDIDIDDLNH